MSKDIIWQHVDCAKWWTSGSNQSLSVRLEARRHKAIRKIYGSRHGIRGILEENLVDGAETQLI